MYDKTDPSSPRPKDRPWMMRTYSGHSSAAASNELYRKNLAKGQTGLSVAFDLPTQIGYDSDDPMAHGEVGKVGVPICDIADMERLFEAIPLGEMNTSMTINATAPWLLALYVATAERQGVDPSILRGTTQNDIIKEYLSRGTYIFPPQASVRLTTDVITYTVRSIPNWNPINVCSYHLQEAGATPEQELAYALTTAIAILDAVRESGQVTEDEIPAVVGRISFFVNAGVRFIEEVCKMRAFAALWDEIAQDRYGVADPKLRRFRYGVQVNSLGLTEQQPENNVIRIVLEALGVTLSKRARANAIQLPAWNEALGLPRPWDQQWSLRIQQILAFESDILDNEDIFDGSTVIESRVAELAEATRIEIGNVLEMGGAVAAVESGYIKSKLVESNARRMRRVEDGDQIVVGVNAFEEHEPSPLTEGADDGILTVSASAEAEQIERLNAFRSNRNESEVAAALKELERVARTNENIMPATIAAAHAGVTTGEWAGLLREVFGEYRAPTGLGRSVVAEGSKEQLEAVRSKARAAAEKLGRPVKVLIGKPGLDGHSNGAEQIALRARDAGLEVVYEGIRLTPDQIAHAARDENVDIVGVSILSGSHLELIPEIVDALSREGAGDIPVVVGGIIPDQDAQALRDSGVARIYTPSDYNATQIIGELIDVVSGSLG
ncbi:MAG: protein meaA [Acidobacteria bacterium]|nr:MAG: protein meaA [Acidobacteriota bacterium]